MRYSNLHTHSTFSDGKHSLEENVLSAIEKNMVSLGFSDHSFTPCDTSYCMLKEKYTEYLHIIGQLKQTYADQIRLYAGIELDYYSEFADFPIQKTSSGVLNFDYIIASVHYIIKNGICYPIDHSSEQQLDCIQNAFGGDVFSMAQCYYDMLCEHVERVRPTLVGHFDVITKFSLMPEDDERYRKIARDALIRILKTCPYIEVNTGAIARGWRKVPYPAHDLFRTIQNEGGEVVLNSDSHHRDNLIFGFDETVKLLKRAGFNHICVFHGKGFEKTDLK